MEKDREHSTEQLIPEGLSHSLSEDTIVKPKPSLRELILFLKGKFLLSRLFIRFNDELHILRSLTRHLEDNVFPELREEREGGLTLRIAETQGALFLEGIAAGTSYEFPGTEVLAERLASLDVEEVWLDAQLEFGQIVEAMLMLFYAGPFPEKPTASDKSYDGWRGPLIAEQMLRPEGYHKFCCSLRFDPEQRRYSAHYTFCEMFFSRLMNNYLETRSHLPDHRALFKMAPRAVVITLLLFIAAGAAMLKFPFFGAYLFIAISIAVSCFVGMTLFAMGGFRYEREHNDKLMEQYFRQVRTLSRFPQTDPHPVLKLDREGNVLYANPGAYNLLKKMGLDENVSTEILPGNYQQLIKDCLLQNRPESEVEVSFGERQIAYTFTPFLDEHTVIATGMDVTYLKIIEGELRDLNQNLENKVSERTDELLRTQQATILSLASLAEARDPETGRHLQRTSIYVRALAIQLQKHSDYSDYLTDEAIEHLSRSVPLHDIGKVGIPDAILLKPGLLTEEERAIMREHPKFGGDALKHAEELLGANSFLDIAQEVAYYHHERWDGTGYPYGLKGTEIPIPARLMALADVYDALTTRRVYKEAFSHEKSRELILAQTGSTFDPVVTEAFLAVQEEFRDTCRMLEDQEQTAALKFQE